MKQSKKQVNMDARYLAVRIAAIVCAVFYLFRLFSLQVVHGAEYLEKAEKTITRRVTVSAPRGEILDRYGRALVKNRTVYAVVLNRVTLPKDTQNDVLRRLLIVLTQSGTPYADGVPISAAAPYTYLAASADDEEARAAQEKKIEKFKESLNLKVTATAHEVMEALYKRYKIGEMDEVDRRAVAGLRYDMEQAGFSSVTPYTVMTDVEPDTLTVIRERYELFPGVSVETETEREYVAGTTAAHLLGRVGRIFKEEADEYRAKGYSLNDSVGKDGIEKTMEEYLRGISGSKIISQNTLGKVNESVYETLPQPGGDVRLTIDKRLQEVAEASLAATIRKIAADGRAASPGGTAHNGWDACAGSVVAIKVNTGEVLVSASYPTFSPETFNRDYTELSADKNKPMFNRVIGGVYAPGSTFKMATALAGLMEGVITPKTIITDKGVYVYNNRYKYKCWIYSDTGGTHGDCDVVRAIKCSCNYFFYETGNRLGIDKLDNWCTRLGLGQKTGIELPGEMAGTLASPAYKSKAFGEEWYPGDTLTASIGQSYNLFTPLQLCNYVATLVNGGTRYQPTVLYEVDNRVTGEKIKEFEPIVAEKIDIPENFHTTIMQGMAEVTESGTASNVFGTYPIKVGGKTGTATVSRGSPTGVFVAFAPFDKPEIAVAVVIEHGAHGNLAANVAKDIFDRYFADSDIGASGILQENEMINR